MANSYFQFKVFKVNQEKSAMKVCTDSCLLGAYAGFHKPAGILDIGTGSGLLSLMLAQRYRCRIDAVEIEPSSAEQAKENFLNSLWKDRLHLFNQPIQEYSKNCPVKYDLIVSNPPFFHNHLKSPDFKRNRALHTEALSFADLAAAVSSLLAPQGHFFSLLPPYESDLFDNVIQAYSLYPIKKLKIFNAAGKPVFRIITTYSFIKSELEVELLVIRDKEGNYTAGFKRLLEKYYLEF